MWNYARFVALAVPASAGMLSSALAMQRTSPARKPNDAALNASETREEA